MRPFRVSIAGVMGIVVIAAVGLMGLREGTPIWAALTFGLTLLFLLGSSLNAALRPANYRAGWLGFALFGWVYLALNFGPWSKLELPPMPNSWLVDESLARLHPDPVYEEGATWQSSATTSDSLAATFVLQPRLKAGSVVWGGNSAHFRQTAHSLGALAFGAIGAVWSLWLARRIARTAEAAAHPGSA